MNQFESENKAQPRDDLSELNDYLSSLQVLETLAYVSQQYDNDKVSIAFSGAEDVVLIDMAVQVNNRPSVFVLDTGRLHPETYAFIERVRKYYPIDLDIMFPDRRLLEEFVRKKGLFSFFEDGHKECCFIRKVEPLVVN